MKGLKIAGPTKLVVCDHPDAFAVNCAWITDVESVSNGTISVRTPWSVSMYNMAKVHDPNNLLNMCADQRLGVHRTQLVYAANVGYMHSVYGEKIDLVVVDYGTGVAPLPVEIVYNENFRFPFKTYMCSVCCDKGAYYKEVCIGGYYESILTRCKCGGGK